MKRSKSIKDEKSKPNHKKYTLDYSQSAKTQSTAKHDPKTQLKTKVQQIINRELQAAQSSLSNLNCNKAKKSSKNIIENIWRERIKTWKKWNQESKEEIANDHFDWWMFPWSKDSLGQEDYYTLTYIDCKNLLQSHSPDTNKIPFVTDYIAGLKKLIQSSNLPKSDPIIGNKVHPSRKNKIYCSFILMIAVNSYFSFFFFVAFAFLRLLFLKKKN